MIAVHFLAVIFTMTTPPLSPPLTKTVLTHLGVSSTAPTLTFLNALIAAYTCTVPWETAFRIVKRANTADTNDCPRWPDEFWDDVLQRGGGGTCFESNYAFFSLLRALGYKGYLTINNMGESIACHTAIIIDIEGQAYLVDAGLPLYVSIPLDPDQAKQASSPFHLYTSQPDGGRRSDGMVCYQIKRSNHPQTNCFTLLDKPVSDADYRVSTQNDYGPEGLFLDRVIINKIVGEQMWRFNSTEVSLRLETYPNGQRVDYPIEGEVAQTLADHFKMDVERLRMALSLQGIIRNES